MRRSRAERLTQKKDSIRCFTLHNVSKEALLLERLPKTPEVLAAGWQHEFGDKLGHEHIQGWILFRKGTDGLRILYGILGEKFGKSFVTRGTIKEQINYCTKPGDEGENFGKCFYPVVKRIEGICKRDMHEVTYLQFEMLGDDGPEKCEFRLDDDFIAECQAEYARSKMPDTRVARSTAVFQFGDKKRKLNEE